VDVVVVGLSHKTARVEQREKVSLSDTDSRELLRDLLDTGEVTEAVTLSTCNRTEIYVASDRAAAAEEVVEGALLARTEIDPAELACVRYARRDASTAAHLFRVASGLDSMVVGESEILGQVRGAWRVASEEGACGPMLDQLFRRAVEIGKRVRTETHISAGPSSVSAVAVDVARQAFDDPERRRLVVIGAGKMASAAAMSLGELGFAEVVVVNRTVGSARELADRMGGRAAGFDRIGIELRAADLVISATGAPHTILTARDMERTMVERGDHPMVVVDISVPRDVDSWVGDVEGVTLYDIDDLERVVEASLNGRRLEARRAERLVSESVDSFADWRRELVAAPTITSLRRRAEEIRLRELERVAEQWEGLSPADRERLNAVTRGIVNKLLHEPTIRVKEAAARGDELRHVETLRHLFDLEGASAPEQESAKGLREAR
jgi:glutamyl-tRNA reductase